MKCLRRPQLLKIAGEGQFGVRGLPALKRSFAAFDEAVTGCVPTETFYRVVTRLGVRIGSKGRKKLTHLLGVEGGEKVRIPRAVSWRSQQQSF